MKILDPELRDRLNEKLGEFLDDLRDPEIREKMLEMSQKEKDIGDKLCKFNQMVAEIAHAAGDNMPLNAYVFFLASTKASIENTLSSIAKRRPDLVAMVETMVQELKTFSHPMDCATCPNSCGPEESCEDGEKGG